MAIIKDFEKEREKLSFSRRDFISKVAAPAVATPLCGFALKMKEMLPQTERESYIHIFTKPLQWMSYDKIAETVAAAGADGLDIPVRPGGQVLPENVKTDLPRAVSAAKKQGLRVDMIVTSITGAGEQYTEDILKTASELGIKYYRLGYLNYDDKTGVWNTLQKYKPVFRDLEAVNRKYGIHGAYQNHYGTRIGGPVWDLFELLRDLDPQYIGCQYDVRHAVAEGGSSWVNGLKLIAPWIKCTDIKDFKWTLNASGRWNPESVPIGNGMVNFAEYFRIVKSFDIKGPVSIHLEYPPFERFGEKISEEEKQKLFIAEMKKDVDTLKGLHQKHRIL